jgi:hypothetical protein
VVSPREGKKLVFNGDDGKLAQVNQYPLAVALIPHIVNIIWVLGIRRILRGAAVVYQFLHSKALRIPTKGLSDPIG